MSARTLIFRILTLLPVFALAIVGIDARMGFDRFDTPQMTAKQTDDLLRYIPFLTTAENVLGEDKFDADPFATSLEAERWIVAQRDGLLEDLLPVANDDNCSEGPKSDIFMARNALARTLFRKAQRIDAGPLKTRVRWLMRALQLLEVGKYSDLGTVYTSNVAQRRILPALADLGSRLSPADRAVLALDIEDLVSTAKPLDPIVALAEQQYKAWVEVHGVPVDVIERPGMLSLVADDHGLSIPERDRRLASRVTDAITGAPRYVAATKVALSSTAALREDLESLYRKFR